MSHETTDVLCEHCSTTFSTFLRELAEKNAQVVCPSCGKPQTSEGDSPATGAAPAKQSH